MQGLIENQFHLYQTLVPHVGAVRSLAVRGSYLITGSIDKTCKVYKRNEGKYSLSNEIEIFDDYILSLHIAKDLKHFIVGCKNSIIYKLDLDGNPILLLEGHSGPVNSLSESDTGKLISGSWDGRAIVWDINDGKQLFCLDGHTYAVAVLALPEDIFVTSSQDKNIHIFQGMKKQKTIKNAHNDIVRELVALGDVGFLSCSNDEIIKIWSIEGEQLGSMVGHTSFVFSLNTFKDGRVVSGSEDKSLKIWKNEEVAQSISHPSTIWTVRVDEDENIITACGDGFARIFSSDAKKVASEEELTAFERESEMAAAQGPEGLSEAELAKLPSVDALKRIQGKKDGEIRIFKNGNNPEAYVWKAESKAWEKIGDVIGNKSTSVYEGDRFWPAGEYDYIFEVDDESGISKKIPYNNGDNPLESAEKFIAREGLSRGYLEQITTFIRQNSRKAQGQAGGQTSSSNTSNKQKTQNKTFEKKQDSKFFPYTTPITYEGGNFDAMTKKLLELNETLKDTQHYVKDAELNRLHSIINKLKDTGNFLTSTFTDLEFELIQTRLIKWPADKLLPILDLLRIFLTHSNSEKLFSGLDMGLTYLGFTCQVIRSSQSEVVLGLALKILSNLTKYTCSRQSLVKYQDLILDALDSQQVQKKEKDTFRAVLAAFVFNLSTGAIDSLKDSVTEQFFKFALGCLDNENNQENILKYLVAIGNVLKLCPSSISSAGSLGLRQAIGGVDVKSPDAQQCRDDIVEFLA